VHHDFDLKLIQIFDSNASEEGVDFKGIVFFLIELLSEDEASSQ
jgi:hypothetical protein